MVSVYKLLTLTTQLSLTTISHLLQQVDKSNMELEFVFSSNFLP